MDELTLIPDPKNEIEFWLKALSNPSVSQKNKDLLNECLQSALKMYINPLPLNVDDEHPFAPFAPFDKGEIE